MRNLKTMLNRFIGGTARHGYRVHITYELLVNAESGKEAEGLVEEVSTLALLTIKRNDFPAVVNSIKATSL